MSGASEPTEPPQWGVVGAVALAAAFAVGFAGLPLRAVGTGLEYIPGEGIDNPLNVFVLEHGYRCLTGQAGGFWHAPSFYPGRFLTTYSDAHIGMQPVYATFRALGASPERAFQGHFLFSFVMNFAAAAWALKRLGFGPFGGAAGAYLFAFGLPLVAQLNHGQLFPRFFVPVAVVLAWEWVRAPRGWKLAALAACVVGQIYVSVYTGYFLLLLLAAGFGLWAVRFRRGVPWSELVGPGRREWRNRVALAAGVAMLPLVVGHARGMGAPSRHVAAELAPTPGAWLTPPSAAWLCPELGDRTGWRSPLGEHQLFPGFAALAGVAAGLVFAFRPGPLGGPRAVAAVGAAAAVLLAALVTRFGDVWPYTPVSYVPGTGGFRAVARVVLVLLFPMGVALAALVDSLVAGARRVGRAPALAVGAAALALVAADNALVAPSGGRAAEWAAIRYPLAHLLSRQAQIADAIRRHPAPAVVYVFPSAAEPKPFGPTILQVEAMRAAQECRVPCVNGWSGYVPIGWDAFADYRGLINWLTVANALPDEQLNGLVVVGEPTPDPDAGYEAGMRARFPPRPLSPQPAGARSD